MFQFLYGFYDLVAKAFFLRDAVPPVSLFSVFGVAAFFSFLAGFLLIGIPGALGLVAMQKVLNSFGWQTPPSNEATWGIAILISFVVPFALPLAHFAARWGLPRTAWSMAAIWSLWGLLVCFLGAITKAK